MADPETPSADEQARALYEEAESQAADAFEQLVSKPSFAVLLARSAENIAAITRIGADLADLVLRNLRVAGRADVTRLSRQLNRTEDKLERLLQELEELRGELARRPSRDGPASAETGPVRRRARKGSSDASGGAETDAGPGRTREAS